MLDLASGAASPGTNTSQGAPASGAGGVGIAPRSSRACKKPVGHYATPPRGRRETGSPGSPAGDSSSGLAQAPPASTERRSTSSGEPSNARAGRSGRSGRGGATQSRAVGHEDDTSASTSGSSKRKNTSGGKPPTVPRAKRRPSGTTASGPSMSKTAGREGAADGERANKKPPKSTSKGGIGEQRWYQLHPRTSLSIGAYKKDSDCNVGVVILDKIVACRTTVKDNKGFEDPLFKGYSDMAFRMWTEHILIPLEADLRRDPAFKGDSKLFLDPGSFPVIVKYVNSQKTQYSDAQKKARKGTGSAAEPEKADKPLAQARARVWGDNKACNYPPSTHESSGEPRESQLSPPSSKRPATEEDDDFGGYDDGASPTPDLGVPEEGDDDAGTDDDVYERAFSQNTPPQGSVGRDGASKGKGKGRARGGGASGNGGDGGGTPRRDRGRGQKLQKFSSSSMDAFARGNGSEELAAIAKRSASAMEKVASAFVGGGGAAGGMLVGGGGAAGGTLGVGGGATGGMGYSDRQFGRDEKICGMMIQYQNANQKQDCHQQIQALFQRMGGFDAVDAPADDADADADDADADDA